MTVTQGRVHSWEVGSFVDGPGIRFVVFLAGCPLRCRYCHNPDTWDSSKAKKMSSTEILQLIAANAEFLSASGGGVTLSGGEPLAQPEFAHEILSGSKRLGLNTVLDTSGYCSERFTDQMLADVDLVLLDIKSIDPATYRELTGVELSPTLAFAERLSRLDVRTWIRLVLVPGLTDDPSHLDQFARFVSGLRSVELVEVLPFHQMGRAKWEALGLDYALGDTPVPTEAQTEAARDRFRSMGLRVEHGEESEASVTNG